MIIIKESSQYNIVSYISDRSIYEYLYIEGYRYYIV